ncbi:hypothetical protein [Streptococcus sobrinus]|uniref:Uncharacterized protein n=1 Tax=Streptococcus sobrinus TaxID=1310 RepID=A0ABN5LG95_9STRE|nr:hypothetical protein [Streptococcus sobrinus]AWN20133.1 hypothetical protein DK182_01700 [Streptococcus sobrinus]EMP72901.1 hypothetical protein D823_00600 [Streptococcus sobrinus DSM 20742 = ATCC 33478]SQG12849.1 Uncharacterised protein [Streptococcus sobrinus]
MKILVLKTNKLDAKNADFTWLKKELSGNWKINPKRLDKVEQAVLLLNGECIATFKLGSTIMYNKETGRCNLELVQDNNQEFFGKRFDYGTSNPATLADKGDFLEKCI